MANSDYTPGSPEWELEISRRHYIQSIEAVHEAERQFHEAIDSSIQQAIHLGEAQKAVELRNEE